MKRTPLKRKAPIQERTPRKRTAPMKRSRPRTVPADIKQHWANVRALGCCVTFTDSPTIHHVHGGSIREVLGKQAMPGGGQKQNDWLVIPLHPRVHTGQDGIDNGMGTDVAKWEAKYGRQIDYLRKVRDQILRRHGYDMFVNAKLQDSND